MEKDTGYMGHPVGGPYMSRKARRELDKGLAQPGDDHNKIDNLFLANKDLEAQLAQAKADNAGLVESLAKCQELLGCDSCKESMKISTTEICKLDCNQWTMEGIIGQALFSPHPGADLLARLEALDNLAAAITRYIPMLPGEVDHLVLRRHLADAGYKPMENGVWARDGKPQPCPDMGLLRELEQYKASDASKEQYIAECYSRAREAERELALYKKALELASDFIDWDKENLVCPKNYECNDELLPACAICQGDVSSNLCWHDYFLNQAKEALANGTD